MSFEGRRFLGEMQRQRGDRNARRRRSALRHALEETILDEARVEISYADHKASILLAALGIAFAAFLGGLFASDWRPTDLESWGEFVWWLGGVCALASGRGISALFGLLQGQLMSHMPGLEEEIPL